MKRARICQLIGFYDHGGICRVAVELALRLRRFFDVTLVCRKILRKPEEDVKIIELNTRNTIDLWIELRRIRELFDIVHTHDVYSLPGLVTGRRSSKVVYTDHGIVPLKYQSRVLRSFQGVVLAHFCRFFARWADVSVGISNYITDELKRIGCKNILMIPNGVDIQMFKPIDEPESLNKLKIGSPMLLKVGLIEKHKGVDYHIAAMPFILKKFPRAKLVFIGAGKDLDSYRRLIKAKGLDRFVHFLGWIPRRLLSLYYNAADVILQVDYWHGFGLPILEGMACGKPVIARNAYAMKEHILLSGAGVLVDGRDPRELVTALEQIFSDYESYSLKARRYAERFSWNEVITKYIEVYEKVLSNVD